jgi:hypothetical protein
MPMGPSRLQAKGRRDLWHCVYDLKTGAFSVPPDFAENNATAVKYPEPK